MNRQVLNLDDLFPIIDEVISSGGEFRLFPRGVSMLPLLRQGKDSVVLVSPDNVAENDMMLYKRDDGHFILHRVIEIKDGEYIMCGDNQYALEHGITKAHLLAKVAYFYHDDTKVPLDNEEYLRYVNGLPKRRKHLKRKAFFARVKNKLFGKKADTPTD